MWNAIKIMLVIAGLFAVCFCGIGACFGAVGQLFDGEGSAESSQGTSSLHRRGELARYASVRPATTASICLACHEEG